MVFLAIPEVPYCLSDALLKEHPYGTHCGYRTGHPGGVTIDLVLDANDALLGIVDLLFEVCLF